MQMFARKSLVAFALLIAASSALQAQARREKELRVDLLAFQTADGTTTFGAGIPGSVALGIYLSNKIAIEPTIAFNSVSGDNLSVSVIQVGVFVPYYLKGDTGRSGLFIAPGLLYGKVGGDFSEDGTLDFGVDVGVKKTMRDNVVMRLAGNLRTGDSYQDGNGDSQIAFGATWGIGVFWK